MAERLAKFMARSGVCSRRDAEELIKQKRVTVNGEICTMRGKKMRKGDFAELDGEKITFI